MNVAISTSNASPGKDINMVFCKVTYLRVRTVNFQGASLPSGHLQRYALINDDDVLLFLNVMFFVGSKLSDNLHHTNSQSKPQSEGSFKLASTLQRKQLFLKYAFKNF